METIMKELEFAIIKWIDSTFYRIEDDFSENIPIMLKPRLLISAGILLHEDNNSMTICQDTGLEGEGNRLTLTIPKVSISWREVFTKKINVD
jgi:hypothetical protein